MDWINEMMWSRGVWAWAGGLLMGCMIQIPGAAAATSAEDAAGLFARARVLVAAGDLTGARSVLGELQLLRQAEEAAANAARDSARNRARQRMAEEQGSQAASRLGALATVVATLDYASREGIPMQGADLDVAREALGFEPAESDGQPDPALMLEPEWVLATTEAYVLWQLPAAMRAPRAGYRPSARTWVMGTDNTWQTRYRLAAESVDGLTAPAPEAPVVSLGLARGEYEPFQVIVTPKTADLTVGKVQLEDLVHADGRARIPGSEVQVNLVGYVWGTDYRSGRAGVSEGPYPDVLFPEGHRDVADKGTNYSLWLTVHAPMDAQAGEYTARLTLDIGGRPVTVPLRVRVWDFALPEVAPVATSLFGFAWNHLCYWYGVAPWEERARDLMADALQLFARNRFSPYIPPYPRIRYEDFPRRGESPHGPTLEFSPEQDITLASPRFDTMLDGFTLCFWLKADAEGPLLDHRFGGRPSGLWAALKDNQLVFHLGYGTSRRPPTDGSDIPENFDADDPDQPGPKPTPAAVSYARVAADFPTDGAWRHVTLQYDGARIRIFLDGRPVAEAATLRPFMGSWTPIRFGGSGADFALTGPRWFDKPLEAQQIAAEMNARAPVAGALLAYDLADDKYDFPRPPPDVTSAELDDQWFWQWVDWTQANGLHLSGLPRPQDPQDLPSFVEKYYQPLAERGMLDRGFVRLPNDEAFGNERAVHNQRWAAALRRLMPGLRTHQTLGVMGGARTDWATRDRFVREYHGLVDIWAMRPLILQGLWSGNFKERVAAGDEMAPYIHAQCWMTRAETPLVGRLFFWYLKKFGANRCTLWITNLWFQAIRPDGRRAERRTWEDPWGFIVSKRNRCIGDGTIFWPGRDGVLSSIRAESWRDGIEDYAYFNLLESRLAQARAAGAPEQLIARGQAALEAIAHLPVYGRHWEVLPDNDSGTPLNQRTRIAELIEELGAGTTGQ